MSTTPHFHLLPHIRPSTIINGLPVLLFYVFHLQKPTGTVIQTVLFGLNTSFSDTVTKEKAEQDV